MSIDRKLEVIRQTQRELLDMKEQWRSERPGSGGGDGGMDHRLDKLEGAVEKLDDRFHAVSEDLAKVRVEVATLAERVSHLPSKGYIDARLGGLLTIIAALITFGEKLQALVSG